MAEKSLEFTKIKIKKKAKAHDCWGICFIWVIAALQIPDGAKYLAGCLCVGVFMLCNHCLELH